jgi:CYTH domain-containing protein
MATEIERKFLVADLPDLGKLPAKQIEQGYVTAPGDTTELRLRRKGSDHFLTVKSKGGLARAEHEVGLSQQQFDELWPLTQGRRVEKTRHTGTLPCGTQFELDVFSGALAPLVLVEVEFATLAAAHGFVPPSWFGADVTDDSRYKNHALASSIGPKP